MQIIQLNGLHSNIIHSIIELSDKRIATGSSDGSLSITSINYNKETFSQNIKKKHAHQNWIESLCELNPSIIASSSIDSYIKIWKYTYTKLTLINSIQTHRGPVWKLFLSNKNLLFSASADTTIQIREISNPFTQLYTLKETESVYNILISQYKPNRLIASCGNSYMSIWDISSHQKVSIIPGLYELNRNGMIELKDGMIAISTMLSILIVNVDKLKLIKSIQCNEYNIIFYNSSLCTFDNEMFIYVYNGNCVYISNEYEIKKVFKTDEDNLRGYRCLITIDNGKYIISENKFYGFSIVKTQHDINKHECEISIPQNNISDLNKENNIQQDNIFKINEFIFTGPKTLNITIKQYQNFKNIHSTTISSILELSDKRIVIASSDGSISLNNYNYFFKTWKQQLKKENAHSKEVTTLCEIPSYRLVSGSIDSILKIWNIIPTSSYLILLHSIQHNNIIAKVIPLTYDRFASCSNCGNSVILWNSISYQKIETTFEIQENPSSLLQLKQQDEVLVINCWNDFNSGCLKFYNLSMPYQQEGLIQGVFTDKRNGMIEISNGHIATSCCNPEPTIFIVDPCYYVKVATIIDKEYILNCGPLCVWKENSFLYGYKECICEVAYIEGKYEIVYRNKKGNEQLYGTNVILGVNNGKYLITDEDKGINVFCYSKNKEIM